MNFLAKYKAKKHNSVRRVLIDNIPHPTFMLHFMYMAHVLNTKHGADIYFVDEENSYSCYVYRQLGYIPINSKELNRRVRLRAACHYFFNKFFLKFYKKELIDLSIGKIFVGDLLIDTIVRYSSDKYTLDFGCTKFIGIIRNAYNYYHRNLRLITKYKLTDAFLSHVDYLYFGMLPRLGLKYKMVSHLQLKGGFFKLENESDIFFSSFHATGPIYKELMKINKNDLKTYLDKRFNGEEKLFSADEAFRKTRRTVSRSEFVKELNLNPDLPICTIYLHAFSDANHYEQKMIYRSYFEWCMDTINVIKTINHVNWVVKDHPLCCLYDEVGVVPALMKKYNINYVPDDINARSILEISDSIVTVRGTVGLEAPNFDIKPILSGYSYYNMYGFTINCETKEEYYKALSAITFKTQLTEEQKYIAARILYWTADLIATKSEIVDYNLQGETYKETERNFNSYINKIEEIGGIENDSLYKGVVKYFEGDKKTLTGLGVI
jgi:hypothetical protein